MLDPISQYAQSIGQEESGNRYGILGPVTKTGDRAYGRYQVMGSNVGPWTQAALGRSMSPQEFLNSPEAQDAVFRHQFGSYVDQYGDPGKAAAVWFGGPGALKHPGASDGYTTVDQYVSKFRNGLDPMAASAGLTAINKAMTPSTSSAPQPNAAGPAMADPNSTDGPLSGFFGNTPGPNQGLGQLLGMGRFGSAVGAIGRGLVTAANPTAGAMLQAASFNRAMQMQPQLKQIGQDLFGRPQYAMYDPATASFKPLQWAKAISTANSAMNGSSAGGGASAPAPSMGGIGGAGGPTGAANTGMLDMGSAPDQTFQQIDAMRKSGATPDQIMSRLPLEYRSVVQGMLQGQEIPADLARSGMARTMFVSLAHAIDPTFTPANYDERKAQLVDETTKGKFGQQLKAADQLMGHLSSLNGDIDAMNNTSIPIWNKIKNTVLRNVGDTQNQTATNQLGMDANAVAGELVKVMRNNGGAEADIQQIRDLLDPNQSPAALHAGAAKAIDLMHKAVEANVQQHNRVFHDNKTTNDFLSPEAKAAAASVNKGAGAGTAAPQLKDGATATGPNGHKIVFRGGNWFDATTGSQLQ